MNEAGPLEELRRARRSIRRTRWVLVGLSVLLAVVLVLSGAVIIGVIVGLMAVARALMIVRWQRHSMLGRRWLTDRRA